MELAKLLNTHLREGDSCRLNDIGKMMIVLTSQIQQFYSLTHTQNVNIGFHSFLLQLEPFCFSIVVMIVFDFVPNTRISTLF